VRWNAARRRYLVRVECFNCGSAVPEGGRYCPQCGLRQRAGDAPELTVAARHLAPSASRPPRTETAWDVCEIRWWQGYIKADFYAHVVNPNGDGSDIARSPTFWWRGPGPPSPSAAPLAAHKALVKLLVDSGWEPVGEPRPWFAQRFRRRVFAIEEAGATVPSGRLPDGD
jgi:hypothetical protein